jgi:hypothetical protein
VFLQSWQDLSKVYEYRGTSLIDGREIVLLDEVDKWALVQCRGITCLGAINLSWCRFLIAGRCAYPGATTITNLSWAQEQSKNHDKQLPFIVRVMRSYYYLINNQTV